jgi:hypothetical protein
MLDIVAVMVVKDDAYYVSMAIKSVLPFVRGVYIQDQMSVDGTYGEIKKLKSEKIWVDLVDTGHKERFEPTYNEPYWRSLALRRAEELFNPAWILKIDADDMFTPFFFHRLDVLLADDSAIEGVRVSGDRPISKDYWAMEGSYELEKTEFCPEGGRYGDPHTQLWRAGKYYYIQNPALPGTNFHPVLFPDPQPVYWLPGLCNIHLHRTFGPKAFAFWAEGGDVFENKTPFHPPTMAPKWYNHKVNMGSAEKRIFEWPDYVIEKWEVWGVW